MRGQDALPSPLRDNIAFISRRRAARRDRAQAGGRPPIFSEAAAIMRRAT